MQFFVRMPLLVDFSPESETALPWVMLPRRLKLGELNLEPEQTGSLHLGSSLVSTDAQQLLVVVHVAARRSENGGIRPSLSPRHTSAGENVYSTLDGEEEADQGDVVKFRLSASAAEPPTSLDYGTMLGMRPRAVTDLTRRDSKRAAAGKRRPSSSRGPSSRLGAHGWSV